MNYDRRMGDQWKSEVVEMVGTVLSPLYQPPPPNNQWKSEVVEMVGIELGFQLKCAAHHAIESHGCRVESHGCRVESCIRAIQWHASPVSITAGGAV
jgi:hypothetical protein